MKKTAETERVTLKIPPITLNAKEQEALQAAVKVLNEQNDELGLLDPLGAEPATIFFAEEEKR